MSDPGFESDACYFDLVARQTLSVEDQKELRAIAATYRALARSAAFPPSTPQEHWAKRAEECRILCETFKTEMCRTQLTRLAETYETLAGKSSLARIL